MTNPRKPDSDQERRLQRRVLEALDTFYPAFAPGSAVDGLLAEMSMQELAATVQHLQELGLVTGKVHIANDGSGRATVFGAKIEARGRDYLKADGGLAAELDTVVVRLHADTIRALLDAYIEQSDLDASAKRKLSEAVRSLPAKGLEEAVVALAREGLARWPAALQWLQTLTGQ